MVSFRSDSRRHAGRSELLGYSNRWYTEAYDTARRFELGDDLAIRVVSAPCFLATKLEAFDGRGRGDFVSHDIEDIVTILDGREAIVDEVRFARELLQRYLRTRFQELLASEDFLAALPAPSARR